MIFPRFLLSRPRIRFFLGLLLVPLWVHTAATPVHASEGENIFEAFAQWMEDFDAAVSPAEKAELGEVGLTLGRQRRIALQRLITTDSGGGSCAGGARG